MKKRDGERDGEREEKWEGGSNSLGKMTGYGIVFA